MKAIYTLLMLIIVFLSFGQSIEISPNNDVNLTLPRLSYQQILAISSPKTGSLVYDISSNFVRMFDGSTWKALHRNEQNTPETTAAWKPSGTGMGATNYVVDDAGYIYVSGYVYNYTNFNNGITINPNNNFSMFLVKYSPEGRAVWIKKSTAGYGSVVSLKIGTDSQIYLLIQLTSSLTFEEVEVSGLSNSNYLLMKLDLNGNMQWRNFGYSSLSVAAGMTLDNQNNVYVSGNFSNALWFNNSSDVLTKQSGNTSAFYVKYASNGTYQWSKNYAGTASFGMASIEVDTNGDMYMIAEFSGQCTIGANTYTSVGERDFAILKANNLGVIQSVKQEGGALPEYGVSLKIVGDNLFVMGNVTTPSNIGGFNLTSNLPPNFNYRVEMFWGLFNKQSQTWSYVEKSDKGAIYNAPMFELDAQNNFYLTGSYFPEIQFGDKTLSGANNANAYYLKGEVSTGKISYLRDYASPTAADAGIKFGPYIDNKRLLLGLFVSQTALGNFVLTTISQNTEFFLAILEE